jgi:hypothetical protein
MKNIKLAVALSAVLLSVTSLAQADSQHINHQFMSQRAYHAPVDHSSQITANTPWEGTTYRPAESNIEDRSTSKGMHHLKQLKIHALAKRSFM